MSSSLDDEPPNFEQDHHLLASSSYPLEVLKSGNPRYGDEIEDDNAEVISPSSPLDTSENWIAEAQEEGLITARRHPIYSPHSESKKSIAAIFQALHWWVEGPRPPRPFKIQPILPQLQNAPLAFLQGYFPQRQQRFWLLIIVYLLWISTFLSVLSFSISGCQVPGYKTPVRLSCISRFW